MCLLRRSLLVNLVAFVPLLAGCAAPLGRAIHFACDEPSGTVLRDAGELNLEGRFNATPATRVQNAYFQAGEEDAWRPLLHNGAQIKNIERDTERVSTGGDIPIMAQRGADYAIDYVRGRIKALPGGVVEPGAQALAEATYANPGPSRCEGRKGRAVLLDGYDDFVDCGEPAALRRLAALSIDLWFRPEKSGGAAPHLLTIGGEVALGLDGNVVLFRHKGLKTKDSKATPETRADAPPVTSGKWHHLEAVCDGAAVEIRLDGRRLIRRKGISGIIATSGPLRIGGCVDPHFFGGALDEITIRFDGPAPSPCLRREPASAVLPLPGGTPTG